MNDAEMLRALKPYGYDYLVSATGVPGRGNLIVVFATPGDFLTACINAAGEVVWVLSCGGCDEQSYTTEANDVHRASRALFAPSSALGGKSDA